METEFARALSGLFVKHKSFRDVSGAILGTAVPYPTDAAGYDILEDCGRGVSATVYKAYCRATDTTVAVKKMNLEGLTANLDEIIAEAQLMKNYSHPNVLPLYTSFVDGSDLWLVMPYISGGSVLHIMKYAHPDGLEETVIATIMRDVLKALDYVHRQGGIHRDIKAGNILVNQDGSVKLADFGVATSMDRAGSWGHGKAMRMTFVGTPCWMAPEVMEQTAGYDNAADIWSFGITMLELAHGHAPFAKYPPMKVLLMTLQNPPPSLEDKGKKHFSKAMRDVVTRCLQKDPRNRPTASQLLEHKFFKQTARDEDYLAKHLMAGLPPLGDRVQEIRQGTGKAATLGADNERNLARSQEEYAKGVSSWVFDVAALKAQAELEPDDGPMLPTIKEDDTLTGTDRLAAADFIAAQAAAVAATAVTVAAAVVVTQPPLTSEPSASAFGTQTGQAATVAVVGISASSIAEGAAAEPPAILSPSGLQRDSSKPKTKGRFTVHDDGDVPPLHAAGLPTSASSPFLSGSASLTRDPESGSNLSRETLTRDSEDGSSSRRDDKSQASFSDAAAAGAAGEEPKKKGRFTVRENGGATTTTSDFQRKPSQADLAGSLREVLAPLAKAAVAGANGEGVGKDAAPAAGGRIQASATAILPRLQELLDHAASHQAALQRLVAAVHESERTGRTPVQASVSLFESDNVEELRAVIVQLQARLAETEADNARLRAQFAAASVAGQSALPGNGNVEDA